MKFYILGPIILGLILIFTFILFVYLYKKHLNDNWTNAKKKGSIFDVFK